MHSFTSFTLVALLPTLKSKSNLYAYGCENAIMIFFPQNWILALERFEISYQTNQSAYQSRYKINRISHTEFPYKIFKNVIFTN